MMRRSGGCGVAVPRCRMAFGPGARLCRFGSIRVCGPRETGRSVDLKIECFEYPHMQAAIVTCLSRNARLDDAALVEQVRALRSACDLHRGGKRPDDERCANDHDGTRPQRAGEPARPAVHSRATAPAAIHAGRPVRRRWPSRGLDASTREGAGRIAHIADRRPGRTDRPVSRRPAGDRRFLFGECCGHFWAPPP